MREKMVAVRVSMRDRAQIRESHAKCVRLGRSAADLSQLLNFITKILSKHEFYLLKVQAW